MRRAAGSLQEWRRITTSYSAWMEVVEEESEKDADFARVWAALSDFRANYKIWGDLGYLD